MKPIKIGPSQGSEQPIQRRPLFPVRAVPCQPSPIPTNVVLPSTVSANSPHDGTDNPREKQGTLIAFRGQGQVPVPSPSFFVCLGGPLCVFVESSFSLLFQPSGQRPWRKPLAKRNPIFGLRFRGGAKLR